MPFRDREPPDPPGLIRAEWQGSSIEIHDYEGIIEDLRTGPMAIYDRSDFPFPIERVQVATGLTTVEEEPALEVEAIIQLDRTDPIEWPWLNDRFAKCLGTQASSDDFQRNPPFIFKPVVFANSHMMVDETTNAKFLLWLDHGRSQVHITNSTNLSSAEKELNIDPQPLRTIAVADYLKSFGTSVAMVVDFVNAFKITDQNNARARGLPLQREYIMGRENRHITPAQYRWLGRSAVEYDKDEDSTESDQVKREPEWNEDAVEKFEPDNAVTLSDIGGLERVKAMLQDVATSFKHPETMEKWGAKRPQGVLLYGEPGTGKTMLAQALANEVDAEMWMLQSSDIYDKWLGNSEQHIKGIFSRARKSEKPLILFFDEFESIVGMLEDPSGGGAGSAINAVAGIFKQEMNNLAKENPNVLVVAATNDLDRIDPSLIRSGRFDYKIYVPMPDREARQSIVASTVAKTMLGNEEGDFKVFADDLDVSEVAHMSDGMSGADITEIFRRLGMSRAMQEARTGQAQPPISQNEIEEAINDFRQGG